MATRILLPALALAAVALLAGASALARPPAPSGGGYELHCYFVPEVDGDGVYTVRVVGVHEAWGPQGLESYRELVATLHVAYTGLGGGSAALGPGSLVCTSREPPPLVVEVVRGWRGSLTTGTLAMAPVAIGFWSSIGSIEVEYLGVDGKVEVDLGTALVVSDVAVFRVTVKG